MMESKLALFQMQIKLLFPHPFKWYRKSGERPMSEDRTQKQPQSFSDRGCQEAGDESRTHNIQRGSLEVRGTPYEWCFLKGLFARMYSVVKTGTLVATTD